MNSNPENIPNQIFDWINSLSFQDLTEEKQRLVLLHFTEDEYSDMHLVASGIRSSISTQKLDRKELLMIHFDCVQKSRQKFSLSPYGWKIAAGLLLLLCSGLLYNQFNLNPEKPIEASVIRDTILLMKNVASDPIRITDTIFIVKNSKPKSSKSTNPKSLQLAINSKHDPEFEFSITRVRQLGVKLETLNRLSNKPKGNTMKDDSLLRKYSFVTL